MHEFYVLRSSIKPHLIKKTLFRGVSLGSLGALVLLISGSLIPKSLLSMIGFPVFAIGMSLIIWGLLPYRKLSQLEKKPDQLILYQDTIEYYSRDQLKRSIQWKEVISSSFISEKSRYGIRLVLRSGELIYFNYFSERSYQEMVQWFEA